MRVYWYWPFARSEELGLAEAMAATGVELTVDVIDRPGAPAAGRRGELVVRRRLPEVRDRRTWSPGWAFDRATVYARRAAARRSALRSGHLDLAHVLFPNLVTDALDPTLRNRSFPVVASVHDVVPHHRRLPRPVEDRVLRRLYSYADRYVVHDAWLVGELERRFGVDPDRVEVVPLPVHPPAGGASSPAPDDGEILCFGTLRANKGIEVLLAAIVQLADRTDLRFRFAGRGVPEVEAMVRDAARRDPRVTAELGWVAPDRKAELYDAASLVVLPYRTFSSQSAVLHDAYAHGRPVVVTDVGALGPSVRDDGTGWVVPPDDADAIAAAIAGALDDAPGRAARAAAAREVAATRTPAAVAARLRAVYDRLT